MRKNSTDFFKENDIILLFFEVLSNSFDPLLSVTGNETYPPVEKSSKRK